MSGNIGPSGLVSTIASVERPVIRRVADPQRRVESPTERAVEDAITRNPGISREQWVPVPPRAVPARTAVINVHCIDVGFGQVLGTQGAKRYRSDCSKLFLLNFAVFNAAPSFTSSS